MCAKITILCLLWVAVLATPERAADYISGSWSHAYDMPSMPVDGVLVGTAAMTAKEAHTSPQVEGFPVQTPGITEFEEER